MSLKPDGTYECDGCGAGLENSGAEFAVTISGSDPGDPRRQRILQLCLPREEDGKRVRGCRDRVLTRAALRHYHESRS